MNSVGLNFQQYNYSTIGAGRLEGVKNSASKPTQTPSFTSNPIGTIPFNQAFTSSDLRTSFINKAEKEKYNTILKELDKPSKKQLKDMLKSGVLLNANSNNKSTVLDSLYKISTTQRAQGLSNKGLLTDTIGILADPFSITQQFGDIPISMQGKLVDEYIKDNSLNKENIMELKKAENDVNVKNSGTCVASSIEFNLAKKMPAEFARFVEGLTSPAMAVEKEIKLANLADNTLDSVWLLNAFEIPYEMKNFDTAKLKFAPDKNAIVRAQIQTTNRDIGERSPVDVLMQSTLMQTGSQQTYDTISDKRKGKFNQNDKGLIEFEKTFTESVVEDKNKISVTYQTVDENARLVGYETDFETMKRQITDALKMDENVIVGYTQVDSNNEIINGHEITIIGQRYDDKGKLIFICNDTDDDVSRAIEYSADYLLPKIHHAGLPQKVVEKDVKLVENWVEGLKSYNESKKKQLQTNQSSAA